MEVMGVDSMTAAAVIAVTALASALLLASGLARSAWIEIRAAAGWLSYAVRPYDMLADRRRWFWQPRQPCGHSLWIRQRVDRDGRAVGRCPSCGEQWSDLAEVHRCPTR